LGEAELSGLLETAKNEIDVSVLQEGTYSIILLNEKIFKSKIFIKK